MDDILKEFLVESYENMDRLDRDLVALEKEPHGEETLASIFRTIHTLKGGSGFLGLGNLELVAHAGENLLSKLRDGVIVITPELTNALLATVDAIRYMLSQIETTGNPGAKTFSTLIELLNGLSTGTAGVITPPPHPGDS
jgi:two-component system chemotaxis sensor kinase CheA